METYASIFGQYPNGQIPTFSNDNELDDWQPIGATTGELGIAPVSNPATSFGAAIPLRGAVEIETLDNDRQSVEDDSSSTSSISSNESSASDDSDDGDDSDSGAAHTEDEEIIAVRPTGTKPDFSIDDIKNNPLASMLDKFLGDFAESNAQLEADNAVANSIGFELGSNEDEVEGEAQYIEMNLGLGVLEEKLDDDDTSSEESESSSEDGEVMDKLLAVQDVENKDKKTAEKKVLIEEL